MSSLNGFDASTVEPNVPFEVLPADDYIVALVESQTKPTKKGDGELLELRFDVLEGPYKGKPVWARLNIRNPNEQATAIALGQLSALCRAVGVLRPKDSVELHNLPLRVKVTVKKRDDNGELTNEVKGFKAKTDVSAIVKPEASGATQTSKPAPWLKKSS